MATKSWPALKLCHNKRRKTSWVSQEYDDLLSELPEEILLSIVYSFTVKEAARFSLVSRRCEFLCRHIPVLIFEDSQAMKKICGCDVQSSLDATVEERPRFVKRVDCVLEKHLGTIVDELRITFDLDPSWQSHVDKWVAFAIDKQVKRLEFNFSSRWRGFLGHNGRRSPVSSEPLDLSPNFTSIKSLTSLCLKNVNVTDELSDNLSHSCPLLENLCIVDSTCLTRVAGSFEHLKHLEVSHCRNLKIDITARMLHSLILHSHLIELHIRDASSLLEVSIGAQDLFSSAAYALDSLSVYFSQLVYLCLKISLISERNFRIDNPVTMPNLQHLELQVVAKDDQSLQGLIFLIAACPGLQKLTLKLGPFSAESLHNWRIRKWAGFPLKCLKTLELRGYVGQRIDLELAFFVFENASMLEEVIIDFVGLFARKPKRVGLQMIEMKLPQGVKLTVK